MSYKAQRSIELVQLDSNMIASYSSALIQLASRYDLALSHHQADLCVSHLLFVEQVNRYMNLTRIQDIHDALVLHILDSLILSRILPAPLHRFLDMGTGAGFPGVPFHILTGCHGVLLDSVGKKVHAVNAFIQALGLHGISGIHARLEEYALQQPANFDLVLARAVGQVPLLIEYAAPFLTDNGYLVLAKARPSDAELEDGRATAMICGLDYIKQDEFDLPGDLGHRTVLLYRKTHASSVELPRPVGTAKRQPLV